MDMIPLAARPYIFTASSSPSVIASTRAALQILSTRSELRSRLWENAHQLYQQLQGLGFQLGPEPSPVVAVRVANIDQAIAFWKGLLEAGVYVNLVTPPATPDGSSLLRCSVSAGHSPQQIEQIGNAFASLRENVYSLETN
jgi:8-amino-7-oxononanoate synthase